MGKLQPCVERFRKSTLGWVEKAILRSGNDSGYSGYAVDDSRTTPQ